MKKVFLNGTAMSGQADHHVIAGATFVGAARTAPHYRFVAVRDEFPGLVDVAEGGTSVAGELYEITDSLLYDSLLPEEPPELELGTIELIDGTFVHAMQLQPERIPRDDKVVDITVLGEWRAYQAFLRANRPEALVWLRNGSP
jgi:gamma-glutamylcyclotransferase (GGCT)/AIG2-like uncharacterized protein YtfP